MNLQMIKMFQTKKNSSVELINYHRYLLLAILVLSISQQAEPCRGGRIIGRKHFYCQFRKSCFFEYNIE